MTCERVCGVASKSHSQEVVIRYQAAPSRPRLRSKMIFIFLKLRRTREDEKLNNI